MAALRQRWPRMTPYERRWLQLLADCCAASAAASAAAAAAAAAAVNQAVGARAGPVQQTGAGAAAAVAPLSVPVGPVPSSRELLARARELLLAAAEEQDEEGGGSEAQGNVSGSDILPPALFGSAPEPKRTFTSPLLTTAAGGSSSSGSSSSSSGGLVVDVVARYSYCEAREDAAVAELLDVDLGLEDGLPNSSSGANGSSRNDADDGSSTNDGGGSSRGGGSEGVSVAGLWPELGLLNHSCVPNAALLVVGGALYVRAGRVVLEGEEVTVSYLSAGAALGWVGGWVRMRTV